VVAGLAAGIVPTVSKVAAGQLHYREGIKELVYHYTPYDPWGNKFSTAGLGQGLLPLLGGVLIHKYVGGSLGVNRALAASKLPFLRL
jgi:hypothetical protein